MSPVVKKEREREREREWLYADFTWGAGAGLGVARLVPCRDFLRGLGGRCFESRRLVGHQGPFGENKKRGGNRGAEGFVASRMPSRRTSQTTSSSSTALEIIEATERERQTDRQTEIEKGKEMKGKQRKTKESKGNQRNSKEFKGAAGVCLLSR